MSAWRKLLSCYLFPVWIGHFGQGFLRYEQMPECRPAREHGAALNISLVDFLKESLTRAFGESWYVQLRNRCSGRT